MTNLYDRSDLLPGQIPPHIASVFWAVHNGAHTYTEICRTCRISRHTAWTWVRQAREWGLIDFTERRDATVHSKLFIVTKGDPDAQSNHRDSPRARR